MKKTKDTIIAFAFILCIGIIMVLIFSYVGDHPSKSDCVIGRDSPDCLEGAGSGHPLYQK